MSDPFRDVVYALISERVREVRPPPPEFDLPGTTRICVPIKVVFDWNGVECPLAETPSGSLKARREMIVHALTDLCMEAVSLHDCADRVVQQVHDR